MVNRTNESFHHLPAMKSKVLLTMFGAIYTTFLRVFEVSARGVHNEVGGYPSQEVHNFLFHDLTKNDGLNCSHTTVGSLEEYEPTV